MARYTSNNTNGVWGNSVFVLETYRNINKQRVTLTGLLSEMPTFGMSTSWDDAPISILGNKMQEFFCGELLGATSFIGAKSSYVQQLPIGIYSSRQYAGTDVNDISLKFKVYTQFDSQGTLTSAKTMRDVLMKYAVLNNANVLDMNTMLRNIKSGLTSMKELGTDYADALGTLTGGGNNNAQEPPKSEDDQEKNAELLNEKAKADGGMEKRAKNFSKQYLETNYPNAGDEKINVKNLISKSIVYVHNKAWVNDYKSENWIIAAKIVWINQNGKENSWDTGIGTFDKLIGRTAEAFEDLQNWKLISSNDMMSKITEHMSPDVKADFESSPYHGEIETYLKRQWEDQCNKINSINLNDDEKKQHDAGRTKTEDEKLNETLGSDTMNNMFSLLGQTFKNHARVSEEYNRSLNMGAKLWNLYINRWIYKEPLVVAISDWSCKPSKETYGNGEPVYYDFEINCKFDQIPSATRWKYIFNSGVDEAGKSVPEYKEPAQKQDDGTIIKEVDGVKHKFDANGNDLGIIEDKPPEKNTPTDVPAASIPAK